MRERLVLTFVGLTIVIIGVLGVTRAYFLAGMVQDEERANLERSATLISVVLHEHLSAREPITRSYLLGLTGELEGLRYQSGNASVQAGIDPATPGVLIASRSVPGGGALTMVRSRELVEREISDAIMPLVLVSILMTALAALSAFVIARRLARPFQELASAAATLGSGRFTDVQIGHYSIPEAENIGASLRVSAARLTSLLQREREFAANASHQLRTPITAMRLQLEDLAYWPETPPSVADELQLATTELDRLNAAIKEYLDLSRGKRRALEQDVDLTELASTAVTRRTAQVQALGRTITLEAPGPVPARTQPSTVDQILQVLMDNAIVHGMGRITVTTGIEEKYLVLGVRDQGRNTLDSTVFQRGRSGNGGTGLGLALATDLAHTVGGRLELGRGQVTCFELRLPKGDEESV